MQVISEGSASRVDQGSGGKQDKKRKAVECKLRFSLSPGQGAGVQTCCAVSHWPSATLVPGRGWSGSGSFQGRPPKSVARAGC